MGFENMWKQLKQDIEQQSELSDCLRVDRLLNRIAEIEEAERKYWASEDLPF